MDGAAAAWISLNVSQIFKIATHFSRYALPTPVFCLSCDQNDVPGVFPWRYWTADVPMGCIPNFFILLSPQTIMLQTWIIWMSFQNRRLIIPVCIIHHHREVLVIHPLRRRLSSDSIIYVLYRLSRRTTVLLLSEWWAYKIHHQHSAQTCKFEYAQNSSVSSYDIRSGQGVRVGGGVDKFSQHWTWDGPDGGRVAVVRRFYHPPPPINYAAQKVDLRATPLYRHAIPHLDPLSPPHQMESLHSVPWWCS